MVPDDTPVAMRQATQPHRRIAKSSGADGGDAGNAMKTEAAATSQDTEQHKQYLGSPEEAIPQNDLTIDSKNLPQGVTMSDANLFDTMYKEHCEVSSCFTIFIVDWYVMHMLMTVNVQTHSVLFISGILFISGGVRFSSKFTFKSH